MSRSKKDELIWRVATANRRYQNAVDLVDEAAVAQLGLNRSDARCLDLLGQHGRLTAGDLARRTGLTTGAVTGVLDRLERMGFVHRVRDEADRRKVFAELTRAAEERSAVVYGPIGEEGAARLRRYTTDELRVVLRFLEDAIAFLEEQAERIRRLDGASRDGGGEPSAVDEHQRDVEEPEA